MANTTIAWAEESFNPIKSAHASLKKEDGSPRIGFHCVMVSSECQLCYSSELNNRMLPNAGHGLPFTASATLQQTSYVDLAILTQPLHWKKSRRVFPCSMTDWCGEFLGSFDAIFQLLAVAAVTPRHRYLFLTKRPQRLWDALSGGPEFLTERIGEEVQKLRDMTGEALPMSPIPLANCWLGCSAGTQGTWERFRGSMEKINFAGWHTWLSAEPLLERVDFDLLNSGNWVEFLVIGGESGFREARRCNLSWIRDIIAQADEAEVATFLKQLGRRPTGPWGPGKAPFGTEKTLWSLKDTKGENPEEFPDDLKFRRAYPAAMVGEVVEAIQ